MLRLARAALFAFTLILAPALALAQGSGAIQQLGPVTTGHVGMWAGNATMMDAGGSPGAGLQPANNANPGTLPTGLGTVNTSYNYCGWTGYANNPYSEVCMGFDGSGNVLFLVDRVGDSFAPTCNFKINGVLVPCGGGGGTISGIAVASGSPLSVSPANPCNTGTCTLGITIPTANLLGGDGLNFTSVTVGAQLLLSSGTLSAPVATSSTFGTVKPDNTSVTILGGVISAVSGGGGTVTSITANNGLTASPNPIIATGTIGLATIATGKVLANYTGSTAVPTATSLVCADLTDAGTACPANTGSSGHTLPFLDASNTWSAGQAVTTVNDGTQPAGGTLVMDFNAGNYHEATFGAGNLTIANPSNIKAGECGMLALTQDGTGSRTATWGGDWKWTGGTAPTLTTTASASDLVTWCSVSTSVIAAQLAIANYQ